MVDIIHKPEKRKFVIEQDGLKARLKYRIRKRDIFEIGKTEVPEEWRGRGVGKRLVNAAVAFAKSQNYSIRSVCSFAKKLLNESDS